MKTLAGRSGAGYSVGGRFSLNSFGWSPGSAILNLNAPVLPGLTLAGVQSLSSGGTLRLGSVVGRVGAGYSGGGSVGLASFDWTAQSSATDPTPSFGGLEHRTMGGAILTANPGSGLTVGPLRFAGADGVTVLLPGNVDGAGVRFAPDTFPFSGNGPNNARFEFSVRDGAGAVLGFVQGIHESTSGFKVRVTFGGEDGGAYDVRVLGDPRGPFNYSAQNWTMWWPFWPREIRASVRADGALQMDVTTDNIPGFSAIQQVYVNPPGVSFGQLVLPSNIRMISRQGLISGNARLGAFDLRFGSALPGQVLSRVISEEWIEKFSRRLYAAGQTGFRSRPEGLTVVGLGAGEQDGVRLDLRHPALDEIGWRGSSSARVGLSFPLVWPAGASLRAIALGPKKLDESDADSEFTRFVVSRQPALLTFAPDFALLLPTDVVMEVLDADGNVARRDGANLAFNQVQFPSKPALPASMGLDPLEAVPPCFFEALLIEGGPAWGVSWASARKVRLPDDSVANAFGLRWSSRGGRSIQDWAPPARPSSLPAPAVLSPGRFRTLALRGGQVGEVVVTRVEATRENPLPARAFSGFVHAPLGNAHAASLSSGLAIANFTTSGEDGVRVNFGSTDGWEIRMSPERLNYGGNLYLNLFSDEGVSLGELNGEHLDSIVWRQRPSGDVSGFNQKLSLLGSGLFQISIEEANQASRVFPSVPANTRGGFSLRYLPTAIRASVEPEGRLKIVLETGNDSQPGSNPFGNLDAGGQYFPTRVNLLTAAGRLVPGTKLGAVEIRSRSMPAWVLNGHSLRLADKFAFHGFGESVIISEGGGSVVNVLGAGVTGADGIRIDRTDSTADLLFSLDAVLGSATADSGLSMALFGPSASSAPFGVMTIAAKDLAEAMELRASFPARGPAAPLVRISDGDRIVAEIPNYAGGVSVRPALPAGFRIASVHPAPVPALEQGRFRAGFLANGALRLEQRWSEGREMVLADSRLVFGDRVSFVGLPATPFAPSPIGLELRATNMAKLVLRELAAAETPVPTQRIYGRIDDLSGRGVDGVNVVLDGPAPDTQITAGGGHFEFGAVPVGGPYQLRPASTEFLLSPDVVTVRLLSDDAEIDFSSTPNPPPALSIVYDQDGLLVSWPSSAGAAGYVLESTEGLGVSGGWQPVSPVPAGGTHRPEAGGRQKFFRLSRP